MEDALIDVAGVRVGLRYLKDRAIHRDPQLLVSPEARKQLVHRGPLAYIPELLCVVDRDDAPSQRLVRVPRLGSIQICVHERADDIPRRSQQMVGQEAGNHHVAVKPERFTMAWCQHWTDLHRLFLSANSNSATCRVCAVFRSC